MKIVKTPIKVRYQETDQMGVVYHANYLVWFEIGRTSFIEELGFQYHEMENLGVVSPVVDADLSFKHPIRYGEEAFVDTWIKEYDGLRVSYGYRIYNAEGNTAVTGSTRHVVVKKESFRPVSIRKSLPDWHQAYLDAMKGE
ncbi:acyl-CoA thioesterase [Sediminibacillus halophilus]|uniref:Acyl-CoA thioester hydrolase n=1 Tax=Sediminibacillus halophilus TaxID=482461 RepID=A0A1G9MB65_9BACI|nr:thioesterase family protein [Sediminibacillus halophilus]SDL70905.1 acyl-CoA thioester hydrolase [Sediminibacillus halophilus]